MVWPCIPRKNEFASAALKVLTQHRIRVGELLSQLDSSFMNDCLLSWADLVEGRLLMAGVLCCELYYF